LKGLSSGGIFVLGVCFTPDVVRAAQTADSLVDRAVLHPNVFVGLETDGTVYITAHRSEMGNGSRTALPRVLVDEMNADWKRVKIVQALGDLRYGSQETPRAPFPVFLRLCVRQVPQPDSC
jgi:isoquinoline 1-oxidoreductase beta subunit